MQGKGNKMLIQFLKIPVTAVSPAFSFICGSFIYAACSILKAAWNNLCFLRICLNRPAYFSFNEQHNKNA